jgi:Arc/MetJ-type ribon-helix-helix transcriptional regulator
MKTFDYNAPAELFPSRNRKVASKIKYRRFPKASEAIRFAVEELPEPLLLGATIQIDDQRLGHQEIRALYESEGYPLKKKPAKKAKDSAKKQAA